MAGQEWLAFEVGEDNKPGSALGQLFHPAVSATRQELEQLWTELFHGDMPDDPELVRGRRKKQKQNGDCPLSKNII